jgi:hypothetical protein
MTTEEREKLNTEWLELKDKTMNAQFVSPVDIRRMDQITSSLMTDGQSDSIQFKFVKGRKVGKGMNITKPYNRKGKVG